MSARLSVCCDQSRGVTPTQRGAWSIMTNFIMFCCVRKRRISRVVWVCVDAMTGSDATVNPLSTGLCATDTVDV